MAHPTFVDYYQILELKPAATSLQVRAAYLRLAKQQHPDKGGNLHIMRGLNQAYGTLRDPGLRKQYDIRYRKHVLGESARELNVDGEDLDLDEVDEFLTEVFKEDQRRRWLSPLLMGVSLVAVCLVLFVAVAVLRMMSSAQAASPASSQGLTKK